MTATSVQKYSCDRCNVDYKKDKLKRQRGMLLCPDCQDDWTKTKPFNTHWRSPRIVISGQELTAVTNPIVFTISTTGILSLSQSQTFRRDGWKHYYEMYIIGDAGGVVVASNPQIVAGQDGDRLTVKGTSSVSPVKFVNGSGIQLMSPEFLVGNGDILSFVYAASTGWVETSRLKEDFSASISIPGSWDFPGIAWDDATIDWDQS